MKNYGIIFLLWYDFSVEENMFNLISILPEFFIDAIKDSVSLIPFLFVISIFWGPFTLFSARFTLFCTTIVPFIS